MGLPSTEQIEDLSRRIAAQKKLHAPSGQFRNVHYKNLAKMLMQLAADKVPGMAVTRGAAAAGVASGLTVTAGITIAPLGAALAPWIAAARIAKKANKIFALHDLRADALSQGGPGRYRCRCGECAANLTYIIDKSDRNDVVKALGVFTFGVVTIGKSAHSIGKSLHSRITGSTRPKERVSKAIVSAAGNGCSVALATVFVLSGGNANAESLCQAIAIVVAEDGWKKFKTLW